MLWRNADVLGQLSLDGVPTLIDTDVNAPAMSEQRASGLKSLCYVSVGTGVGVGAVCEGSAVHGHSHPEAGHVPVACAKGDEAFEGHCEFHGGRCVEGRLRASALAHRAGVAREQLNVVPDESPVWEL